jgi:hypothetical protein
VDYRKLAEEFGGRAEPQPQTETPAVDYRALAEQYGGVQEEEEKEKEQRPAQPVAPEASSFLSRLAEAAKPEFEITREVLDVPLKVSRGAVTGFRMVADAFGAGSGVSEAVKTSEDFLGGLMSAQSRNDSETIGRLMKEAEDAGALDAVKLALQAFATAPIDLVSEALGTAAPIILGALSAKVLGAGALATSAISTGIAGAQGAGLIKGNIYDAVKEAMLDAGDSPVVAEEKAQEAQAYGGKNLDMILAGTALGALAGRTGVEKLILNRLAGKEAAEKGLLRRVGEGAVTEAAPEFVQAAQEAAATNIALQREGIDVPTMRGVVGQATLEGLAGSALGATAGAISKPKASDTPEDRAIADLDKLAADEEAEAAGTELVSEEDLFAEEAAGRIAPEDTVPATLEELKKLDKDLKKKLGRVPTTEEVERALYDFESEKTRRLRAESGGGEPSVSVSSAEEIIAGTAKTPTRIEPTGLGTGVEPVISTGTRKEPTLGPLTPAVNPEDTFIIRDIAGTYNESLINYFRTYYGLKPESMPKAASIAMPLLQRADQLLAKYNEAINQSNQPFLDEPIGSMSRLGMARTTMLPEYQKAANLAPGGLANRLVQKAMALDKGYKRANQSQFDGAVKEMQVSLNEFEQALGTLPPPISDAEKQTLRQTYEEGVASSISKVPKERQVAASLSLLRKGLYSPSMLTDQLDAMVATGKVSYEELDKFEDTNAQKDLKEFQEGKITQATYDARRKKTNAYFEKRKNAPTPTEPTATPQTRSEEIAKLAAELGGVPGDEGGVRPARDDEGAETIRAQAGINQQRMTDLLGYKLYGPPKKLPAASVKEMLQNAFDAIKPMQEKGQFLKGKIDITVDPTTRIISVKDNGTGMIPETLATEFIRLADTLKETERGSGGLGIAKGLFLFGNEQIRVLTLRDGVASELISDGATLRQSMSNPDVSPDVKIFRGNNIPERFKYFIPEGHGTYVEILIPKNYLDPDTGETVDIEIPNKTKDYPVLQYSPLFSDIKVTFNGDLVPDIGATFPANEYTTFANVKFDWGTARIYVSQKEKFKTAENTHILSNGIWQFNKSLKAFDKIIPRDIYIDVDSKAEPTDFNYPFDLNRQKFSPAAEESFNKIFNYIKLVYRVADLSSEVDDFGSVQIIDRAYNPVTSETKTVVGSPILLKPPKKSAEFKVSEIQEGEKIEVKDGVLYAKGKAVPELTDADLKKAKIDLSDFKIDESLIPKDKIVFHNNMGLVSDSNSDIKQRVEDLNNEIGKARSDWFASKIEHEDYMAIKVDIEDKILKLQKDALQPISEVARKKFGKRFDDFVGEIGEAYSLLRDLVADLNPAGSTIKTFRKFLEVPIGISIGDYRGVNTVVPFKAALVNPFAPEFETLEEAASGTVGTMVHELAHIRERTHDADFVAEMQRINLLLKATELKGYKDWTDIQNNVYRAYKNYEDVFKFIHEEQKNGNLKPIGKRLPDSGYEQIPDEGGLEGVARPRGTAEGEPGIYTGDEPRFANIGEERERSRDAGEASLSELEQRVIQLSLGGGDIHPTMISAIANNDLKGALIIASQKLSGFSADLARTLSELNLPTNISFNTGRELVRRSVDNASQPQQERLFKYVRMHYPQVYDKYFKNYDRSESLELVAQGLVELQKPNYKLGPVIAEFGTVAGAYKKYIEGLTSPGAYYPDFDEIVLDTNTLTGKSYRVFLHEVVHAATEYALNTYKRRPQDLSPGQRDAVEELTAMYDFAVEKIGTTPYGMTNIYEFIAEVFTNRKFQDTLKNIKYEPKKAPFFSRLVRTILKMFGLDNLAGNAMAEATKIFSAVRSQDTLSRGPRFAKSGPKTARVKGDQLVLLRLGALRKTW